MKTPSEGVRANILNLHNCRVWSWRQPRVRWRWCDPGGWRLLEVTEVRMGCSCLAAGGRLEDIMRLPCTALGQYSPTPDNRHRNNMFSSTSTSMFVKTHLIESIQFVIFHFYTSHLHPSFFRFLVCIPFFSFYPNLCIHEAILQRRSPVCWLGWYIACRRVWGCQGIKIVRHGSDNGNATWTVMVTKLVH